MAEVLKFEAALLRRSGAPKVAPSSEDNYSFWPEAAQGLWSVSDSQPVDPANSFGRVFFEMMLILGTTAAIAVAISLFVGMPPV